MPLHTTPFDPKTGALRPAHRDAYLRGDLSQHNVQLVDAYLQANPTQGKALFTRFHDLGQRGDALRPMGWLQRQLDLRRTEPARFRQRVAGLLACTTLLAGAVLAARPSAPTVPLAARPVAVSIPALPSAASSPAPATDLSAAELTVIQGTIVDERGQPLVGATVLDKRAGRGVSTDAQGHYALTVPRHQATQLQFGYGGYREQEQLTNGQGLPTIQLQPRPRRPKRWWAIF